MKNSIYSLCKLCNESFTDLNELKVHLKNNHRLSIKTYFQNHWRRLDRFNGEPLEYKSYEQYITCDFKDKRNYKSWLKTLTSRECADYFKHKLRQYCTLKSLDYAPGQAECQTIGCLIPVSAIETFSGLDYNEICSSVNLKSRFDYSKRDLIKTQDVSEIIIDTREQKPFKFNDVKIIESKLEYGDYSLLPNKGVSVERKSLGDLYGTLSGGLERFGREVERAKKVDGYLVVVVEATINNVLYQKRKFGKCSGEFIMHNMRKILRTYDNIQFVFCDGRKDAQQKTVHILELGDTARNTDLQNYYDTTWQS